MNKAMGLEQQMHWAEPHEIDIFVGQIFLSYDSSIRFNLIVSLA